MLYLLAPRVRTQTGWTFVQASVFSESLFFRYVNYDVTNPKTEQSLFFLKGKIAQTDPPFSDGTHGRKLHIVQVNNQRKHIALFADVGLPSDVR
uniref:Uncharacterized protein n=1 Tax=Candidatus Kentrum sp. TUN TaxID=2126343 RepID=A0A450ZUR8_9GAMM|nr:MAG: hypothetical protein BECKTUN1418F_GA0071002_11194 [Candidatus Kentron sp. TUN]VFK60036.1 MAG: hypothetical protein BECKTUN1418D_GA0071000_11137 [Candidatus Kentron sp. TUN]VFK65873.1 MAG: hypothetical protein BECKTUN1418E_GA0071001_11154 [Candidatus Kentron sp. TUN]